MKTAVTREVETRRGGSTRLQKSCMFAALLVAAGAATAVEPADWASTTSSFTPVPLAASSGAIPLAGSTIEISTSNLPRFDNLDGSNRTQQRIDMALLSPGRSQFGVTMGMSGLSPARSGFNSGAGEALSSVNLGLQWRYILDNNRRVDITAWREVVRPNDALALVQSQEPGYGARVEMQLAGSRSPLVAERGFVGMRLDGGGRITLRRSGGKPMIYYRNQF